MTKWYTKIEFINFIFFQQKDLTFPVQIVSIEDDKHEMSEPLSGEIFQNVICWLYTEC